ncbi:hypothetical protein AVP43_02342 [Geobacillus stearothermophilus]|nr:hypothetical protein AVP43_02342 [Geobacillus stearothermophilus]
MLFPWTQLGMNDIPFLPCVRKQRRKTVKSFIRSTHSFFFRIGVVKWGAVYIKWEPCRLPFGPTRGQGSVLSNQQTHRFLPNDCFGHRKTSELIESLSQGWRGRHVLNPHRCRKDIVLTIRFDMIEIRFSCGKQADHRANDVAMGNVHFSTNRWKPKCVYPFIQFRSME